MSTITSGNGDGDGSERRSKHVRQASGRSDSQTVRLSLPRDVVDALNIEPGDAIIIQIDDEHNIAKFKKFE